MPLSPSTGTAPTPKTTPMVSGTSQRRSLSRIFRIRRSNRTRAWPARRSYVVCSHARRSRSNATCTLSIPTWPASRAAYHRRRPQQDSKRQQQRDAQDGDVLIANRGGRESPDQPVHRERGAAEDVRKEGLPPTRECPEHHSTDHEPQ